MDDGLGASSRYTLRIAMIKLVAAMLLRRRDEHAQQLKDGRSVVRGINPDASPQGFEIMVANVFTIIDRDVANSKTETLPLPTLAHKHAGIMDRAIC